MICLPLERRAKRIEELEECIEKVGHHYWSLRAIQEKPQVGAEMKLTAPSVFLLNKRQVHSFNQ